jgi:multidrug resistance efflux pump
MKKLLTITAAILVSHTVLSADIFGGINKALNSVQKTVDDTRKTVDNTQATVDNTKAMVDEAKATAENAKTVAKGTADTNTQPATTNAHQAATFKSACWEYNLNHDVPVNCSACESQYGSMMTKLDQLAAAGKTAQLEAFLGECPKVGQ